MKKFKEAIVALPPSTSVYLIYNGWYGVPVNQDRNCVPLEQAKATSWYGCRETFHGTIDRINSVPGCYFFSTEKPETVADLVWRVEDHLGVTHSEFSKTDGKTTFDSQSILVNPSPWWREDRIRHNFYSLVLRCGQRHYNGASKTDLLQVLLQEKFLSDTKIAVEKFLAGCTRFVGSSENTSSGGWFRCFYNINSTQILLEKP